MATNAVEIILEFAALHAQTCGGLKHVTIEGEGSAVHQRCDVCGAVQEIEISLADLAELRRIGTANEQVFVDAFTRALRRTVQ